MIRISQLKLKAGHTKEDLEQKLRKTFRIKAEEKLRYHIRKQSVDARKKPDIFYVYTIDVSVKQEQEALRRVKNTALVHETPYLCPETVSQQPKLPPVVIGSGPAGLFCAYLLARAGLHPLLLERGAPVEERKKDVEQFWEGSILNPASNVQFGEGGAGTFSDGKLNTLVKDPAGRNRFVLETLVEHGAPESILYENKPHIGTDILIEVVKCMRNHIIAMGGEVRFHSQVTDIVTEDKGAMKSITGLVINHTQQILCCHCVLAVGHSARDTFQMLYDRQVPMRAKSFAVGVRIEHPQTMIDAAQYGTVRPEVLKPASYKLAAQLENGRGVYSFCMCPGGYVVNASSEEKRLAVNGMSYHDRGGKNANSAIIVTVTPEDFGDSHPLAGMFFQRRLEEQAFRIGGGAIPVQCFGDFCANTVTKTLGKVFPQTKGNYTFANLREIFPAVINESLEQGIWAMDKKISGFARKDALLSGVESRTSSPVKLPRNEDFACEISGLYPCGEGAGYAGGITSAAMDGMKVAEVIVYKYTI